MEAQKIPYIVSVCDFFCNLNCLLYCVCVRVCECSVKEECGRVIVEQSYIIGIGI